MQEWLLTNDVHFSLLDGESSLSWFSVVEIENEAWFSVVEIGSGASIFLHPSSSLLAMNAFYNIK